MRRWEIWSVPPQLIGLLLGVELVTLVWSAHAILGSSFDLQLATRAVAIIALSALYDVGSRRVDVLRVRFGGGVNADMSSVWTVAAVFALPAGYAVVSVVGLTGLSWILSTSKSGTKPYRNVYSVAAIVLTCLATSWILGEVGLRPGELSSSARTAATIIVLIAIYIIINRALIAAAVSVATHTFALDTFWLSWEDNLLELATLALGGIAAALLIGFPWLIVLVLPPMVGLQRSALVSEFRHAAMTDPKTGLLNAVAWQELAVRELARASREDLSASLLMIDLDHFKVVNDLYGHIAGDAVLVTVAETLKRELRDYDAIGRFGGEEFIVLLPDTDTTRALLVAQRLREAIGVATIGHHEMSETAEALTVSIGVSVFPRHGIELDELMRAADSALYRAKRLGRDRVVLWAPEAGSDVNQLA